LSALVDITASIAATAVALAIVAAIVVCGIVACILHIAGHWQSLHWLVPD